MLLLEDASPVASDASGASDVEPAPSPAQTPGPPCLTTGPWAALHCLDAESHALFLRSGHRSDLRPACGARLASTKFLVPFNPAANLCGRAACRLLRESL